jgi:hypothetical protein
MESRHLVHYRVAGSGKHVRPHGQDRSDGVQKCLLDSCRFAYF